MYNESIKRKCIKIEPIKSIDFSKYSSRDWDHINSPFKYTTKIDGKSKKKQKSNNLINPNTKRTIIPDYAPLNIFKRTKKQVNNIRIISEEKKLFQAKKRVDIIKPNLNNNNKGKSSIKFTNKKLSQIALIPGPKNTMTININDDIEKTRNKINRKNKDINYIKKIKDDFFSSITCFPNSINNKNFKNIKRGKTYNNFKTNANNDNIKTNNTNNIRYKNQESTTDFHMLKPSLYFDLKYRYRKNLI